MSKNTITNVVISLLLLLVAGVVFGGMWYQVTKQGNTLTEQVAVLEAKQAQEEVYFDLRRKADETVADREALTSHFLQKEGNSIDLLNLVEDLASPMNVSVVTEGLRLVFDPPESEEAWVQTSFVITGVRGDVERFIELLENIPYMSRVMTADIVIRSGSVSEAQVTVQVKVIEYEA